MKINIEEAKEEFIKYTENFNTKDKNVKRKQQHSIRVMKIAEQIATNLKLSEEQIQLATLIGLLHDIGRFKQYTDIGLGNNLEGFDHGDYGTKLLFKEGLIRKFIETNKYDEIIKKSIKNHNKFSIEAGLTQEELLFAKLIRDADRTDIFYILITGEEKTIWETDNMNNEIVTNEIYREFIEDKHIKFKNMETSGDILVGHFAYIYGLYFKPALKIFKDKKYVDQLYNRFSFTNKDTAEKFKVIHEKAKQYIEEKG